MSDVVDDRKVAEVAEKGGGMPSTSTELKAGAKLTRPEFERRYCAHPNLKKAELVDGIVRMPSPVRYVQHARPHTALLEVLILYAGRTPGVGAVSNASVRLDSRTEVQPDALLRIESAELGQSVVDADGYITGAPELVAEVSASSARFDLREKFDAYLRNGVREYLVWQTLARRIDWFERVEGTFRPLPTTTDGVVSSRVFPGLRLAPEAMVAEDDARALAAAQAGLGSTAHLEFIARLRGAPMR